MSLTCNRCQGTGFLNLHQIIEAGVASFKEREDEQPFYVAFLLTCIEAELKKIKETEVHDIQVCDCCGDGEEWYGVPGEHYNEDDPQGTDGVYAYNGGLCECD